MFYDENIQNDVNEETNENDMRKLKISAYTKTTGKDKLKKDADEEHFEEQTELLDNQVKKEQSKVTLHKSNNKIVSEAAEKSAVSDNVADTKNNDIQKKEFTYNGFVLAQREKKAFKIVSTEQNFKYDKHRDLIIKQRRDFAYKQSYKDKLDTRHTYYAELATKTAKEAYSRFKSQDEDAASESRSQSLGDMANDQVRHSVNSVGNAAKNVSETVAKKVFSANHANRQNYIYNNEATFSYKSEKAIEKSAEQASKETAKKAAMKKAAQKKAAEEAAKKASEEAAKKAAATAAAKGVAAGSSAAAGSGAAASGGAAAAGGATAGTPVGLIIAAAAAIILLLFIIIIVLIVIINAAFPFSYITTEEEVMDDEGNISIVEHHEENEVGVVIEHYHRIIDKLIDEFNTDVIDAMFGSVSKYNNTGVVNPEVKAKYDKAVDAYNLWLEDEGAWYDAYAVDYLNGEVPGPGVHPGDASEYPNYYYTEEELYRSGQRRGRIFEGIRWSENTDGTEVPKGKIYNEVLAALATYNVKCWNEQTEEPTETEIPEETEPPEETESGEETDDSGYPPLKFEYLNDDTVSNFYDSMHFWEFSSYEVELDCDEDGECCMEVITITIYDSEGVAIGTAKQDKPYCPGHYMIECMLKLNFDMDMVFERLGFNDEDMDLYDDEVKEIEKSL